MTLVYKDGSRSWEKQVSLVVARWRWQGLGSGSVVRCCWSGSVALLLVCCTTCLMIVGSDAIANNSTETTTKTTTTTTTTTAAATSSSAGGEKDMLVCSNCTVLEPLRNLSFNAETRNIECLARQDNGSSWCLPEDFDDDDDDDDGDGGEDCGASLNAEQCLEGPRPLRPVRVMGRRICRTKKWSTRLANATLDFCNGSKLENVLRSCVLPMDMGQCQSVVSMLQERDQLAQRIYCEFEEVLARYDCQQKYSIKWSCHDCKEEYKRWVCAMLIPYHREDHQVKPCREFCHRVEQKCPYLLPDSKIQYAGEPSFLCIDDNIPETASMSHCSAYGSASHCYSPCHLGVVDVGVATNQCPELILLNGSSSSSSRNCSATPTLTATATANSTGGGVASSSASACGYGGSGHARGGPLWPHGAKALAITAMCLAFVRTLVAHPFCLGLT